MKAVKEIVSKYFEYIPFKQPILSSNGVMGGDSFACNQSSYLNTNRLAWKAFNADNTTYEDSWHSANGHPAWIEWYNPKPLLISSIQVRNRDSDGSFINSYTVSYSDDGTTYTSCKTGTSPNQTAYALWSISIDEANPHKYWRLICNTSSGQNNGYTAIQSIFINAQELFQDYKDIEVYKAVKETIRKYYKYGNNYIDTNYIPFMTSTTLPSGSVINTGSLELTTTATAYSAWGKNQTKRQQWTSNNDISTSYTPASNIPSGHYKLNFQLANYGKWATWLTVKFTLTYSDDTTEDIYTASSGFPPTRSDDQSIYFDYSHKFITTKPIKSIKFSGTSQIGNAGSGWVRSIYIQEAEIIETTEQDYDFYEDIDFYKAVKF